MAPVSLSAAQNPALQQVLAQLAANTPPPEPSWWPPALGYWLILLLAMLCGATLSLWLWRGRHWRQVQQQLKKIMQIDDVQAQSQQLHALLRWTRLHICKDNSSLSEAQFRELVLRTLNTEQCTWLNTHYQLRPTTPDWQEVSQLLRTWRKEAAQ